MLASYLTSLLCLTGTVLANSSRHVNLFKNPIDAARAAAPMWHFSAGTCLPQAASSNGRQTDGSDPDNCNINKLSTNCGGQPQWTGANTHYAGSPTYYIVRYCPGSNTWRVVFDLYFKKDTTHKSDWEWSIVVWEADTGHAKPDMWKRQRLIVGQHGGGKSVNWASVPNTFAGTEDWTAEGARDRNNPKVYVGKFKHAIHLTQHTSSFKNTCSADPNLEFRNNDYQFWAANQQLIDGHTIPEGWAWGQASSYPMSFEAGRHNDVCNK